MPETEKMQPGLDVGLIGGDGTKIVFSRHTWDRIQQAIWEGDRDLAMSLYLSGEREDA